jgi:hypothetical protein
MSNSRMAVNDKFERMWKEAVMAHSKISMNLPGGDEKNQ